MKTEPREKAPGAQEETRNPFNDGAGHAPDTEHDEQTLLRLLRSGHADALRFVMQKYHDRLFHVADRICDNQADAEEVVQDVYWTAFRKIDRFEERSCLGTWLYRITLNASFMKFRTYKKSKLTVPLESLTNSLWEGGTEEHRLRQGGVQGGASPGDRLMTKELCKNVWDSVKTLPEIYQEVFLLRDVEGFSIKETSLLLNASPSAVKSRSYRSRFHVRKELGEYLQDD